MTNTAFAAPIAEQIWGMKYQFKKRDGTPIDETVEDTWTRISRALAAAEDESVRDFWEKEFYGALSDFKFLPAGRITSGAGTDRAVTLFNCYVMGTVPDSMSGIFDMLKEAALTMQQGGGIGYDFSTIRPKGADVVGVAADASGPLTFMDVWDAMCRTVMSAGSRRGAMMATMRCDHPDIEDFITAKQDATRLRMFNLSVLVTDDFMRAVQADEDWRLHFENRRGETTVERYVRARDLWDKIMRSTYDAAEPGVIFIDRINNTNNLRYCETISATNPCGEQPLPPYGACLLGSINLARLVKRPYEQGHSRIDVMELDALVSVAVRALDNVVDVSNFPLKAQHDEAKAKRRIGLGVTGLADALLMCGLKYGSPGAVEMTKKWLHAISVSAYRASIHLAKEKGAFPALEVEQYLAEGTHASTMPDDVKDGIREHGIRNSHLLSIAPTGTISLYAGNVSSGIEPIFAGEYTRKVLQPDGTKTEERVVDYALSIWEQEKRVSPLPAAFVTAQDLTPDDHLVMQAAAQKYVDSSISKTINLPEDVDFEDFQAVYWKAYEMGCKGCTTYRPNEITGSVLSVDEKPKADAVEIEVESNAHEWEPQAAAAHHAALAVRPDALEARVYKVKMGGDPAFYVTIADLEENGVRRPFEVFINTKKPEHIAWTTALTLTISAILRQSQDASFIVQELKGVFDPKGGGWWRGAYRPSIVAAIGQVLEDHMNSIGYGSHPVEPAVEASDIPETTPPDMPWGQPSCPSCNSFNMKNEAGCEQCLDCGHSKCG